ncbi:MAG: hypothetical protein Q8R28_19470, partial [Dehalococcoidia bacterium]|nr:hypothetical protein [Dehalococcoidia bacterium]
NLAVLHEDEIPHILASGEVGAVLELIVRDDRTGQITEKRVLKSESFVRQFMDLLWIQMYGLNSDVGSPMMDITGATSWFPTNINNFQTNAAITVVTNGIIVGTGVAAPTISDFVMQTPIAHGVGAGQLQYSAMTFGAPSSDATTSQFTLTRNFANGSGAPITVNEIGLYVKMARGLAVALNAMTIRDVIGGGIAVPNGQTLTVNYRVQATV